MKITEDEIRRITLEAVKELGDKATPDIVKSVVEKSIENFSKINKENIGTEITSGRIILTSFGLNSSGIIAQITKTLSDFKCDIRDLSQKIMDEFYTMIMVIDITNSPNDLKEIQEAMKKVAEELKVKIYIQHEDVFRFMHRI
ncbi:MAG: ACT domain-containing protein [Ignavibacteriales bacterium CG_4_9_14_3_um_filter_34_10]|nr:MAG: ACT domain-containing protein [Ignavibacteriales bacterium CG_4_9_14_3_um_filter_34_10]